MTLAREALDSRGRRRESRANAESLRFTGVRLLDPNRDITGPVTVTADDLVRATQKLRLAPSDWGAWLEVAAILGALGATDEVELAFATIGEGARVTGRVALAVACGRHLAELGSVRGPELVEQVIETYATGGPHFAFTTPPSPAIELRRIRRRARTTRCGAYSLLVPRI